MATCLSDFDIKWPFPSPQPPIWGPGCDRVIVWNDFCPEVHGDSPSHKQYSQTRSLDFSTLWTSWILSPLSNIPCILEMKCLYGIHDVEGTMCPRDVGRQETLMFSPSVDWAVL